MYHRPKYKNLNYTTSRCKYKKNSLLTLYQSKIFFNNTKAQCFKEKITIQKSTFK